MATAAAGVPQLTIEARDCDRSKRDTRIHSFAAPSHGADFSGVFDFGNDQPRVAPAADTRIAIAPISCVN
jgi:hypothetical protein